MRAASPEGATELLESDVQDLLVSEHRGDLFQEEPHLESRGCSEDPIGSKDEEIHDTTRVDFVGLPSPLASVESAAQKAIEIKAHSHNLHYSSGSTARPRRSRGRVSYVELIEDELSDRRPMSEDEDETDVYTSSSTDDDSEVEEDLELVDSEDEVMGDSDADALEGVISDEDDLIEDDKPVQTSAKARKQTNTANSSQKRAGKGIDLGLPPLNNISDIFADMSAKASRLGLCKVVENLDGHAINVATMCSGTESPLLALDLLSKALDEAGLPSIRIKHHFSAEIEVIKQGYIERNFQPDILFRDIRDFIHENVTTATTAYGAEVPIPTGLDILIAGFVCKDLSRMNNNGKNLDSDGESGDTWRAVYTYVKRFRPSIVLLENVKAKTSTWDDVVSRWDKIGYEAAWVYCDTKNYYLPQTRERMYMIAVERTRLGKHAATAVDGWKNLMKGLRRQCSSPYEAFLPDLMQESSEYSALASEQDWALCKLRYDHIRSDERLGILRTLTRWSEDGTERPPDFANRNWYRSQSSRVYDAIEVAHLQAAKKGYDSLYKMAVWDVSQNVDRFKADQGIVPCITPDGCDFATNRHQALNGKQLLVLQGMPLDKLLFARETQKDCQDLAGNAMSTTVIGASLISAIISGWKSFKLNTAGSIQSITKNMNRAVLTDTPVFQALDQKTLHPNELGQLNLQTLRQSAMLSMRLPARVKFDAFPDLHKIAPKAKASDETMRAFLDRMTEAELGSQYFSLNSLSRQDSSWKATYKSPHARLELTIGHDIHWLLFVACSQDIPGNSSLRRLLEGPIARAHVAESLLDVKWQLFIPISKHCKIHMNGSNDRSSSWRSRLGLPDHRAETVPKKINIRSDSAEAKSLTGDYEYLPHCGTACGSLYKRQTAPALYIFLDPDPIGQPSNDRFVFSQDCSRKHFGEPRTSMASLEPSWRPWHLESHAPREVSITLPGRWVPVALELKSACPVVKAGVFSETQRRNPLQDDCSQSVTMLDVRVSGSLPTRDFSEYSWTLEQAKLLPSFPAWQKFTTAASKSCSCAPAYPRILWSVNEKGTATPHEDRKAAAVWERAIKTRGPIFEIQTTSTSRETQIQVGINISSLIHRARGRLTQQQSVSTAWRLVTYHADLPPEPFPRFHLKSNSEDAPFTLSSTLQYLRGAQPRSLAWMTAQEQGRDITIKEVEEAVQPDLGWRVEARAQTSVSIRGGVLADLPSFGKTVTTIALIQSEFEQYAPKALLRQNEVYTQKLPTLIDSAATLIVCPPHIALQWQFELKKFLGVETYNNYNVILVETFAQLQCLTIDELRESRVIILSWNVFAEEEYVSYLAQFSGMPEPTITSRRAFDAWFSQVAHEIPGQLDLLQNTEFKDFNASTRNLLEERLQHEDFQAALPIKIQHGSAYQSFKSLQKAPRNSSGVKAKGKAQLKRKASPGTEDHPVPLVHLFRFNRIVVDEYHYLNDDKKNSNMLASVSVKRIAAHKRWVLSGTPALANFTDVDQIASYLGIRLGRPFRGDGTVTTSLEKTREGDQTLVEDFLSQTEAMSRQWHQARHERAQKFLDLFVRQNEAQLEHIACSENILPIELNIAHHAVYLELSQHLISQRMQIKKLNNKSSSDRTDRLNASLDNSATAEEALLRSALLFETSDGESGLDLLMVKRSSQYRDTEKELIKLLSGFEGLKKDKELIELYSRFKNDIRRSNWLGDQESMQRARGLLSKAEKTPTLKAFPELKNLSETKAKQYTKKLLSQLRELTRELALRKRSERFISTIKEYVQQSLNGVEMQSYTCSSPDCKGTTDVTHLYLISHCGHKACEECLSGRVDDETCVEPSCNVPMQSMNLIKVSDLGSAEKHSTGRDFGTKLETVTRIIRDIPEDDQGLVFAPNEETISILEGVFDHYDISYHSPSLCRPAAASEIMEDFKTNKDPDDRRKVLILNLGSESAAGVNLVNANHIIFVSPLLAKSQYEYDSAMVQAIARSRRYGQQKKVHICHVVAQRTIDVDILEHRHKRNDGITTLESTIKMPKACSVKKEKTKLIKNNKGHMALVPASWLVDENKRELLGVDENPDSFTSLINFSETFEHDDD
ncbi:hypothetical protein N0V83_002194 [Neocucurbitaria cava]|uniref:SNF2 N-terminal domain-containing protein n=1 Tax=Neocucurbitaria cava TaxID=798079 RepID=A0A9W9CPU4_9PLEO|nr:hypothetical protein N0V83_002194 [Neocucurbitaria cava]